MHQIDQVKLNYVASICMWSSMEWKCCIDWAICILLWFRICIYINCTNKISMRPTKPTIGSDWHDHACCGYTIDLKSSMFIHMCELGGGRRLLFQLSRHQWPHTDYTIIFNMIYTDWYDGWDIGYIYPIWQGLGAADLYYAISRSIWYCICQFLRMDNLFATVFSYLYTLCT